jgi:hemolysin activation/secretion protein
VLVLSLGTEGVIPLSEAHAVPYHSLVRLGGAHVLRGYPKARFLDRVGWWSSVEYRYAIFDFRATGVGLSSILFADFGGVANSYPNLLESPVRQSYGVGIRGESSVAFFFRAQVAVSPEGVEAALTLNEEL